MDHGPVTESYGKRADAACPAAVTDAIAGFQNGEGMDESPGDDDRRPPPSDWQGWQRWVEGVDWSDWRSWLRRIAATDWNAAGPSARPGNCRSQGPSL